MINLSKVSVIPLAFGPLLELFLRKVSARVFYLVVYVYLLSCIAGAWLSKWRLYRTQYQWRIESGPSLMIPCILIFEQEVLWQTSHQIIWSQLDGKKLLWLVCGQFISPHTHECVWLSVPGLCLALMASEDRLLDCSGDPDKDTIHFLWHLPIKPGQRAATLDLAHIKVDTFCRYFSFICLKTTAAPQKKRAGCGQ